MNAEKYLKIWRKVSLLYTKEKNTNSQNLAQNELERELLSLPVRQCDTLKYKQRKMDLEVKLNELDEAIKVAYYYSLIYHKNTFSDIFKEKSLRPCILTDHDDPNHNEYNQKNESNTISPPFSIHTLLHAN